MAAETPCDRRSRHRGAAVAGLLLMLAGATGAQEPLTLSAAMAKGRANAAEVRAAGARVEAGVAQHDAARAHRMPRITVSEVWMRTDSPAGVFGLQLNQERFSFDDFVQGDPNNPDALTNALTRFELMLPIYTGGELSSRIEQAELAAEAAGIESVRVADSAALAAAEAWIRLAQVREQVSLLERALETVDAHVALATAYVDQGMLVASELLRAKVERARIEDLLLTARGGARVAAANLAFRLGTDQGTTWELAELDDPPPLAEGLDAFLVGAGARPDLEAARRMIRVAELEADTQSAQRRPRVGLVARYDLNDDRLFGTNGRSSAVMAMASIDIFNGGRFRAAADAARAQAKAATEDVAYFEEGVTLQIRSAYEEAVVASQRVATARAALDAAAEAERITDERFRQGVLKMIDLLDASNARHEAETRDLVARAEAHLARFQLALASGRSPETMAAAANDDHPTSSTPTTLDSGSSSPTEG